MKIPLGEGNDNPCFAEQFVYMKSDVAFNDAPIHNPCHADPEVKIKNQGIVTKIIEKHKGLGFLFHFFMFVGRLYHDALYFSNR